MRLLESDPHAREGRRRLLAGLPLAAAFALAVAALAPASALADDGEREREVFDFEEIDIGGQLRTPQLLYFLDRARDELRQASLERRSFLPEMVDSVEEEGL